MPQSPTTRHATPPLVEVVVVVVDVEVVAVVVAVVVVVVVAPPVPVAVVDDAVWEAAPPLPPVVSLTKCGVVEQAANRLAAARAAQTIHRLLDMDGMDR
jgi:hypothetical protein